MQRTNNQAEKIEISPQLREEIINTLSKEIDALDDKYDLGNYATSTPAKEVARAHRDKLFVLYEMLGEKIQNDKYKHNFTHETLKIKLEELRNDVIEQGASLGSRNPFSSVASKVIDEAIQNIKKAAEKAVQAELKLKEPTLESQQQIYAQVEAQARARAEAVEAQTRAQAEAAELKFKEPTAVNAKPAVEAAKKLKGEVLKLLAKEIKPLEKKYGIVIREIEGEKTEISFDGKKNIPVKEKQEAERRVRALVNVCDDIYRRKLFSANELQQKLIDLKAEIKPAVTSSGLLSRTSRFFAVGKGNIDKAIELLAPKEPKQSFVARLLNRK